MTHPPMADFDLTRADSYQAPPLECDLIMKGGITSGVLYPLAACRLATRYRFRQVGGASAGAIAAALTAAAEYQRRHPGAQPPGAGFLALAKLPDVLGSRLDTLFQPAAEFRDAYGLLTAAVEPGWSAGRKAVAVVGGLVRAAPVAFLGVTVLVTVALSLPFWFAARGLLGWVSLAVALVVGVLAGLATAAVRLVNRTLAALPRNGYGVCSGMPDPAAAGSPPPLTEWLTQMLDDVAGLPPGAGPLTFGHLYGPDEAAYPAADLDAAHTAAVRRAEPEIDLLMMTTCLTLQRPYTFPFRTGVFSFCPDCWRSYFPASVVAHLVDHSELPSPKSQQVDGVAVTIDQNCPHHPGTPVRNLPPAEKLPVVLGVRLSLSFPGLISAIPFHTIDFTRAPGHQGLIEVWFSDGGITSNFPIHFFDQLWPRRPTFGLNLADAHPDFPDDLVWRPTRNASGILPRPRGITSMMSFLGAVVGSMHNWVDNSAVPAPGFRDRVVELRTRDGEGGLNLKMGPETIEELGRRGDLAAQQLEGFDFDNHRWIRYRTAMLALSDVLAGLGRGYPDYAPFVAARRDGSYPFPSRVSAEADLAATEQLMGVQRLWEDAGYPATGGPPPQPRPRLRPVLPQ